MRDFILQTPFFRLLLALVLGIVLYNFIGFNWLICSALTTVGVLLIVVSCLLRRAEKIYRFRWLFGAGSLILLSQIGFFVAHFYNEKQTFPFDDVQGVYSVELTDNPIEKPRSYLCRAHLLSRFDSLQTTPLNNDVILYLAKDSDSLAAHLASGDLLLVSTTISLPKPSGNPEAFDYGTYLKRKGVAGTAFVATHNWQKTGVSTQFSLLKWAGICRQHLLDIYEDLGITGDEFGMLAALTLGYKDALTPELRESFSTTGAMHVLAVSGLHVGIIFVVLGFLFSFLDKFKIGKRLKPILIIACLWGYAFITGLSPSVLRASLMFSFMAFGGVLGRKSNTYNTIFLSAFFLLLTNPNLLFDVGFQLSYSAVLAIVYFQPKIAGLVFIKNKFLRWAWELVAVSLSAQIGAAPISIFYFHQFPNYFLLSNFVVIPAATLILYGAVLFFLVSQIPFVGVGVAFLLKWVLKIMYACIAFIEKLPHALSIVWIDQWQLLLLCCAIVATIFVIEKKSFFAAAIIELLLISYCTIGFYNNSQSAKINEILVYNDYKTVAVDVIEQGRHSVFTTDSVRAKLLGDDFWAKNRLPEPHFVSLDSLPSGAFVAFNKRFLVISDNYFRYKTSKQPLEVDFLIVNKAVYPNEKLLTDFVRPKCLVTLADVSDFRNAKFEQIAADHDIQFLSAKKQGAITLVSR